MKNYCRKNRVDASKFVTNALIKFFTLAPSLDNNVICDVLLTGLGDK